MKPIIPSLKNPTPTSIIEQVAYLKDVKQFVYGMCNDYPDVKDDLYQELFMFMFRMDSEKLIEIYLSGKLHAKIIATISGMLVPRSSFHSTYIKPKRKLSLIDAENSDLIKEEVHTEGENNNRYKTDQFFEEALDALPQKIEELGGEYAYFDKQLLKKYLNEGNNQSKVSKKYGIHRGYISDTIKRVKTALEKSIQEEINKNPKNN